MSLKEKMNNAKESHLFDGLSQEDIRECFQEAQKEIDKLNEIYKSIENGTPINADITFKDDKEDIIDAMNNKGLAMIDKQMKGG